MVEIVNLLETIKAINKLFCKISALLGISLLKKGRVMLLREGDTVYEQNE